MACGCNRKSLFTGDGDTLMEAFTTVQQSMSTPVVTEELEMAWKDYICVQEKLRACEKVSSKHIPSELETSYIIKIYLYRSCVEIRPDSVFQDHIGNKYFITLYTAG